MDCRLDFLYRSRDLERDELLPLLLLLLPLDDFDLDLLLLFLAVDGPFAGEGEELLTGFFLVLEMGEDFFAGLFLSLLEALLLREELPDELDPEELEREPELERLELLLLEDELQAFKI